EKLSTLSDAQKAGSFEHKRLSQRAAVVAAGPIANFILAIVIFTGSFFFIGIHERDPVVSEIVENSAAAEAGFEVGDIIKAVDGTSIRSFSDIPRLVGPKHGLEMIFTVERAGQVMDLTVVPKLTEREDDFGNVHRTGVVGIGSRPEDSNPRIREFTLGEAFLRGVGETVFIVKRTFQYLGGIVVGRESADQLSGPIGIAKISGDVATLGWVALINLAAVLSVSIGLLNLFPVPMLDGGHLVFYAYEAIFGKPLSERAQELGFRVGFMLLIGLMLFATRNDILNYFWT
ncbi:MAG: RIP metalloprotease RseP, partial [Pseudomonadota bacterium]